MSMIRRIAAILLAAAAAALCGCTAPAPHGGETPKSDGTGFEVFAASRLNPSAASRIEAAEAVPDMRAFTGGLYAELLAEAGAENAVCSPASVYIALAMLAEITGGSTRDEIMTALGAKDLSALRKGVAALLAAETADDGKTTSLIGNSVWLNKDLEYREEPLKQLAEVYHASSFSGDPTDEAFAEALRSWINENTGDLLKDSASSLRPGTVITLANTIYFKAGWQEKFPADRTEDAVFHGTKGDATVPFMHNTILGGGVIEGDGFISAALDFREGAGEMRFFLPDEGKTPADVMPAVMDAVFSGEGGSAALVKLAMPRFDVGTDCELIPALKAMGVNSAFGAADFEPLLGDADATVSRIAHAARVKVDEEGIEAAAYTVITADGAMLVEKNYEIVLDRPFIFVVTGVSGAPLFIGTVNTL